MWCRLLIVIGFNALIILLTLIEMKVRWKEMDKNKRIGSIVIEVVLWVLLVYGIHLYNETKWMLN